MARRSSKLPPLDVLLHTLRTGNEYDARGAAEMIGKHGPDATTAVPDLISAVNDTTRDLELWVIIALGHIKDPRGVPTLIGALASNAPASRSNAVRSLAAIGGDDAVAAIRAMLRDESRHVRNAAAKVLKIDPPDPETVAAERAAAIAYIDAQWRGKPRTCPYCSHTFVAQQSRCKCPQCLRAFYASHIAAPHTYPFESSPPAAP